MQWFPLAISLFSLIGEALIVIGLALAFADIQRQLRWMRDLPTSKAGKPAPTTRDFRYPPTEGSQDIQR